MGSTQLTTRRRVAALEAAPGVTLFERARQGLRLTASGAELVEPFRRMADAADSAALGASDLSRRVEGQMTVIATDLSCSMLKGPMPAPPGADPPGFAARDRDVVAEGGEAWHMPDDDGFDARMPSGRVGLWWRSVAASF